MKTNRRRRAYSLIVVLVMVSLMAMMAGALLNRVDTEIRLARHDIETLRAELLAEDALAIALVEYERLGDGETVLAERPEGRGSVVRRDLEEGRMELLCTGESLRFDSAYRRHLRVVVLPREGARPQIVSFEALTSLH